MGGRKDDVTRTPMQPKRPLSAVLEEFEVDDPNHIDDNNNEGGDVNNDSNHVNVNDNDIVASKSESSDRVSENGYPENSKDVMTLKDTVTPKELLTSPGRSGNTSSGSGDSKENSPKFPRRSSLRLGRRLALTPSNVSPKLGRRGSPSLTSRFLAASAIIESDDDTLHPSDLTRLKQTAERLHLSTRRPSVMQWRAQYVECPKFPAELHSGNGDVAVGLEEDGRWTPERTQRINTALDWIKNELMEMRTQDQLLARQLLSIRSDIHQLKLARSCEEHQDMLDDVQSELEDLQEFADVLDLPTPCLTDSPLKHLGVTRMNFSARRFSTC